MIAANLNPAVELTRNTSILFGVPAGFVTGFADLSGLASIA